LSFVEQVIRHSTKIDAAGIVSQPSPLPDFSSSRHCFLCPAWFQNEEELSEHLAQHADQQTDPNKSSEKLDIAFMDDLEASLLDKPDLQSMPPGSDKLIPTNPANQQISKPVNK
jgi:hypothetical protein